MKKLDIALLFAAAACLVLLVSLNATAGQTASNPEEARQNAEEGRKDPHNAVIVINDMTCGLHRVQINDWAGLAIDGQPYGDYKNSSLDDSSNYVHRFGEKAEIRVTQHQRIAFRLVGKTRWASCKPNVFYQEAGQ